jgi:tetratricopeptide (TPR) repeat protein
MLHKNILRWRLFPCQQIGTRLLLLLVFLLTIVGCGGQDDSSKLSRSDTSPSPRLAAHLSESRRSLTGPDQGDPVVLRDLARYAYLQQALYDPAMRAAAADSFYNLWRAQPDHVLWPELEIRERRYLRNTDIRDEILASPVCTDTTTAIGAYLLGFKTFYQGGYRTQFAVARSRSQELESFAALWIELKYAFGNRISGRPDTALDVAFNSLPQARTLGGRRLEALAWEEIATGFLVTGDLDDALLAVDMADTLAASVLQPGDAVAEHLRILQLKADIHAARRETDEAIALYEANIQKATDLNLFFLAALNLSQMTIMAEGIGDRAAFLKHSRRSLVYTICDQDSLNTPRVMMNIAFHYLTEGKLDSCLFYQQEAERWITAYPDPANVARMPLKQAEYYAQIGEYSVVDSLLSVAASHSNNFNTVEARAELHLELIRNWMESDRPDLVYSSIEAISDLRFSGGDLAADRHVSVDLNLLIGEFLTRRGEYGLAGESLDMAAAALATRESPKRAWKLARNRGRLARERGSMQAAESAFRECIALGRELGMPEYESTGRFLLGSVLLAEGRFAEARSAFPSTDAADFVGRFTTRVSALLLTGISYAAEGRYDRALEIFAEARRACRKWSPTDLLARLDLETGSAHAGAGRHDEAMRFYERVAERIADGRYIDDSPELAYFNSNLRRDLVEAVVASPVVDPAEALRLAREILPSWRSDTKNPAAPAAGPMLVFFVGEEKSKRWTIRDDVVAWRTLPGEKALKDILGPVVADMAVPGRTVVARDVSRLADVLLAGVSNIWPADETLVVVPDLFLFGVPWAALPLEDIAPTLIDHGPLVVHDTPVSAASTQGRHGADGRLLVVGANAVGDASGLETLHHAEREARDVASVWPSGRSELRVGKAAGSALSAKNDLAVYEVIHVASHARVYNGRSDKTTLLLAGENGKALTASDIRELDLTADLVFLSCCEAADGRDLRSGYAGLARSFLDAGARNVVAPLIAIDDEAARAMAGRFYAHWLAGEPVPRALRAAQRDLRDSGGEWSHPFYWAFYQAIASDAPAGGE